MSPSTSTILLIVSALLFVIAIVALFLVIRKATKSKADAEASATTEPDTQREDLSPAAEAHHSASIRSALSTIRRRDGKSRYDLPWYLLMGPEASGKTALLTQSELSGEVRDQVDVSGNAGVTWTFLDRGAVLDVAGDWSFDDAPGAGKLWRRLLQTIAKDRPSRPLDGIILALPADDFIGADALTPPQIVEQANFVQARLRQIQAETGLRLPVYCILTKSDAIGGFQAFTRAVSTEERRSIFGWSNPYSTELQFHAEWVDGALSMTRLAVEYRLNRIFATEDYTRAHDELFLLPGNLYSLQAPLKAFLTRVMRSSPGVPAPFFRGIYLTGAAEGDALDRSGRAFANLLPAGMPQARSSYEWDAPTLDSKPQSATAPGGYAQRISFTHDLFHRKIFGERALAEPLPNAFRSLHTTERALKVASVALACVLCIGMILSGRSMARTADRLQPLMTGIANDMASRALPAANDSGAVRTSTGDLISAMLELRNNSLHSVFYPASWGWSLDRDIQRAMTPALRTLVLERFRNELEARAATVADLAYRPLVERTRSTLISRSVEQLPAYQQQVQFVDAVVALQQHIDLYAQLMTPGAGGNLQTVAQLDSYLNGHPLPILPDDASSPILDAALTNVAWQPFRYSDRDLRNAALKQSDLSGNLFIAAIEQNRLRQATDALIAALGRIAVRRPAYEDVRSAQQAYSNLSSALLDPQLAWVGDPDFTLPPALAAVTLAPLGKSIYLPESLRPVTESAAADAYQRLLTALLAARTPGTGALLELREGHLEFTPRAQEVQLGLDNLLNLSFMGSGEGDRGVGRGSGGMAFGTPSPVVGGGADTSANGRTASGLRAYGGYIQWSKPALERAAALPGTLQHYLSDDLEHAPSGLQEGLGGVAREHAGVAIETAVANAESPGPRLPPEPQLEADVKPAVGSFTAVAPLLRNVLNGMRDLGLSGPFARLEAITNTQALALLGEVNVSFNRNPPYAASLDSWTGATPPAEGIFGAADPDALAEYLAAQRDLLRTYSAVAEPLLDFLAANNATGSSLYRRWRVVGTALRAYDAKRSSPLKTLETFLGGDFQKARVTNGCATGRTPFSAGSNDYFAEVSANLRDAVAARCAVLTGTVQASAYATVADRFNGLLAGRFPFAPLSASPLVEADAQSISDVYRLYESNAAVLSLNANPMQRTFLNALANSHGFFHAVTAGPSLSVDFIPHFRSNREHELGAEQIAAWTLTVGDQVFRSGEAERKGTWTVGQPVTLTLRWARDAPFVPLASTAQNFRSTATEVTYRFTDDWSLLRFASAYPAGEMDSDPAHPDSGLFMFVIPETGVPGLAKLQSKAITSARVFLRMTVLASGKGDVVGLPRLPLPWEAPHPERVTARNTSRPATGTARTQR